jgi:hypothetical protein
MGWLVVIVSSMALAARAATDEGCVLVKVSEMDRTVTTQVMSAPEFKDFEKTLQSEKKYFQGALQLAAKAWKEDQSNKTTPFPQGRIAPRSIVGSPEHFATRTKADDQLNKYQEREAQKEAREKDKTKGKAAKPKDELDKEKKRADEALRAADLVKAKIAELMAGKPGTNPENGAAEKKPAEKADPRKAGKK